MSRLPVTAPTHSRALTRLESSEPVAWHLMCALLAVLLISVDLRAESAVPIPEHPRTATASKVQDAEVSIDEIVVFGSRERSRTPNAEGYLDENLLQRILRDFEVHQQLEEEPGARLDSAGLLKKRPPFRLGYDFDDQPRGAIYLRRHLLPFELVMPATVVSVDF